jgi:hypothetical protein
METNKRSSPIIIVVALIAVCIIGAVSILYYGQGNRPGTGTAIPPANSGSDNPLVPPTSDPEATGNETPGQAGPENRQTQNPDSGENNICGNGACDAGETPETCISDCPAASIVALTPKAGEVYSVPAAQIDFSWSWSGVGNVTKPLIQLLDDAGNEVYGTLGPAAGMQFSQTGGRGKIPAPANLVIPAGRAQYRVKICTSVQKTECGISDYFTIVKPTVSAVDIKIPLDIVAPKAGEVLAAGQEYTIKWKNPGLPAGAVQTIVIMNGTKGAIDEPNHTIASSLPASTTSYTWTVAANNGWGVGLENSLGRQIASLLGVETVRADFNQYVIRISANAPGVIGEVGWGVSGLFTISQPELEKACVDAGGTWDEPNVMCACPKLYYWYPGHGCLPNQGK